MTKHFWFTLDSFILYFSWSKICLNLQEAAEQCGISAMPTFKLYKGGSEVLSYFFYHFSLPKQIAVGIWNLLSQLSNLVFFLFMRFLLFLTRLKFINLDMSRYSSALYYNNCFNFKCSFKVHKANLRNVSSAKKFDCFSRLQKLLVPVLRKLKQLYRNMHEKRFSCLLSKIIFSNQSFSH